MCTPSRIAADLVGRCNQESIRTMHSRLWFHGWLLSCPTFRTNKEYSKMVFLPRQFIADTTFRPCNLNKKGYSICQRLKKQNKGFWCLSHQVIAFQPLDYKYRIITLSSTTLVHMWLTRQSIYYIVFGRSKIPLSPFSLFEV